MHRRVCLSCDLSCAWAAAFIADSTGASLELFQYICFYDYINSFAASIVAIHLLLQFFATDASTVAI